MFEEMLGSFLGSEQGRGATQALQQKGVPQGQIQQILQAALPAAASSLQQQGSKAMPNAPALGAFDVLGGHPGQSFLIAAATSMMRGEGMSGALRDGAIGVVGGRIGEALASRMNMSPQMASGIAAAITPFVVSYAQEHLAGHPDVVAQRGSTPEGQQKFDANIAAKRAQGVTVNMAGGGQGAASAAPQKGQTQQYGQGASPQKGGGDFAQGQGASPQKGGGDFGQGQSAFAQKPQAQDHLTGGYAQKPMPSDGSGDGYPQKPGFNQKAGYDPNQPQQQGYGKGGFPQK